MDEDMDEEERRNKRRILVKCPDAFERTKKRYDEFDDDYAKVLASSDTKLSLNLLPKDTIIEVTYDYGDSTIIYLKVLHAKQKEVQKLLEYFNMEADTLVDVDKEEWKQVPAYSLPKEQQVDYYFPNFSKIFLGHYVPLFNKKRTRTSGGGRKDGDKQDMNDDNDNDDDDDDDVGKTRENDDDDELSNEDRVCQEGKTMG
mmetsp:Transcript_14352/g.26940  ORF Transcript_14352/g.26940 Transcript_14352/m.26940 type:complete len:200 (-) Transcript_14352:196-795(-)